MNPLLPIARAWYGYELSQHRVRKLEKLWRSFTATLPPKQRGMFDE